MDEKERGRSIAIPPKLRDVLAVLLEASRYADDTSSSIWHFAVSIRDLLNVGATATDLRWLTKKGLVNHAREVTIKGDNGREFRCLGDLTFSSRTCFVLAEAGRAAAQLHCEYCTPGGLGGFPVVEGSAARNGSVGVPHWDADARKLQMHDKLVKRFKWRALNQEAVLCAFQEEGWPERIDDPLSPQQDQDSKRRLADTIKCLNKKQINELIHFRGDGTGEGVLWEPLRTT